jgi:hypothetical protein
MRIRLLQGYNGFLPGRELNLGDGVANLLLQRGIAEPIDAGTDGEKTGTDLDGDGQDEGGEHGTKKAFSKPPSHKRNRK